VSTPTHALLQFFIWWVRVKGLLHNFGGIVKLGCGPKQGQKKYFQGCQRMKLKNSFLLHASFITSNLVQE
jgi:hypothetical protein